MAKKKSRRGVPIQREFELFATPQEAVSRVIRLPRAEKASPRAIIRVERLEHADLAEAWDPANRADCRTQEHLSVVLEIMLSMLVGDFGVPNDPVIFDWYGNTINGRKMVQAAIDLNFPLTVPVARGVNPRSRFAVDDASPRNRQRNATRLVPVPVEKIPLSPEEIPPGQWSYVSRMLGLLDGFTLSLDIPGIAGPTAEEALTSLQLARAVKHLPKVPAHLLALLHLFAARLDAGPAPREFMLNLANPSLAPDSAPALLVTSEQRSAPFEEGDFLVTSIIAWGMFRAGCKGDPHEYRRRLSPHPKAGDIIRAFLKGHQPVAIDASSITWASETLSLDDLKDALATSGRPVEAWGEADRARLALLLSDAHHAGGLRASGQSVRFRIDGTVEDGIQRMMASYLAGLPLSAVVGRGFPIGWSSQNQLGRRQSYGHRNNNEGVPNPYDQASACKTLACYETDSRNVPISLERHRLIHARYPMLGRCGVLARDIERMVAGSVSVAALALIATKSRRGMEAFYCDLLAAAEDRLDADTPRHRIVLGLKKALRGAQRESAGPADEEEERRRDSANHASDHEQLMKFEWILLAWNSWVAEGEVPPFVEPVEEIFPVVVTPPADAKYAKAAP